MALCPSTSLPAIVAVSRRERRGHPLHGESYFSGPFTVPLTLVPAPETCEAASGHRRGMDRLHSHTRTDISTRFGTTAGTLLRRLKTLAGTPKDARSPPQRFLPLHARRESQRRGQRPSHDHRAARSRAPHHRQRADDGRRLTGSPCGLLLMSSLARAPKSRWPPSDAAPVFQLQA